LELNQSTAQDDLTMERGLLVELATAKANPIAISVNPFLGSAQTIWATMSSDGQHPAQLAARVRELEAELAKTREKLRNTQAQLESSQAQHDHQLQRNTDLTTARAAVDQEVASLRTAHTQYKNVIKRRDKQIKQLRGEM
jgi:chromosome segregation ATPase